jgi:serine/threonine-protein kinase
MIPIFPKRYQYQNKCFEGGQSKVYVCKDSNLNRDVAIKYIKGDQSQLQKEVSALSKVQSKHVAEIYDTFNDEHSKAIIEEYVAGEDLTTFHDPNCSLDRYLKTLYQIACGICDIHAIGLIHRDIKPNNIKFAETGIIKIVDFGLSSRFDNAITVNLSGTMPYIAPELLYKTPPVSFTNAVDIFAFGITAWFLATGSRPDEIIPSFDKLVFQDEILPSNVANLLKKSCDHNPSKRPKISEIKHALTKELLRNQHVALVTYKSKEYLLSSEDPYLNLGTNRLVITYDGYYFRVTETSGDAYLNNKLASPDMEVPDSCVITLGHPELKWQRIFITFDVSHPEVIL